MADTITQLAQPSGEGDTNVEFSENTTPIEAQTSRKTDEALGRMVDTVLEAGVAGEPGAPRHIAEMKERLYRLAATICRNVDGNTNEGFETTTETRQKTGNSLALAAIQRALGVERLDLLDDLELVISALTAGYYAIPENVEDFEEETEDTLNYSEGSNTIRMISAKKATSYYARARGNDNSKDLYRVIFADGISTERKQKIDFRRSVAFSTGQMLGALIRNPGSESLVQAISEMANRNIYVDQNIRPGTVSFLEDTFNTFAGIIRNNTGIETHLVTGRDLKRYKKAFLIGGTGLN